MAYTTFTLTGTYQRPDGTPATGTVDIRPTVSAVLDAAGEVILSGPVVVALDSEGAFSVTLAHPADTNLNPTGFGFIATPRLSHAWHGAVVFTVESLAETAVDMASVTPVDPATLDPTATYASAADVAAVQAGVTAVQADVDAAEAELAGRLSEESLSAAYVGKPDADGWPIWAYGNSYSVLDERPFFTPGRQYLQLAAAELEAGAITSYGVGGTSIIDVCGGIINGSAITGSTGQAADALWPGTSARSGLVVVDSIVNTIGHYAAGTFVPSAIPAGNAKYIDGVRGMCRAALAVLSSESRLEHTASTSTGTWPTLTTAAYSGGSISRTSAPGAKRTFTVTPPQSGPLAGKVFLLTAKFTTESTVLMAKMTIDVDGANAFDYTPTPWEAGLGTNAAYDAVAITVPVDGAAHAVNITHSGTSGHWVYVDAIAIPSTTPNPVMWMGGEHPLKVGLWTEAQVATYAANAQRVLPVVKAAVAEFPNATYVPSTVTSNGLYSVDGIHINDRGMEQRANDLIEAVQPLRARLRSRRLANLPDSEFPIV